jgi:hypothetical protein
MRPRKSPKPAKSTLLSSLIGSLGGGPPWSAGMPVASADLPALSMAFRNKLSL